MPLSRKTLTFTAGIIGPAAAGPYEWAWLERSSRVAEVLGGRTASSWDIGIRYLFAHTQINHVEASTEITNVAEQRALEKAGSLGRAYCAAARSAKGATATR